MNARFSSTLVGLCSYSILLLPFAAGAEDWWFDAGPIVRGNMRATVSGSSYVQQLGLHDPLAAGPLLAPSGIGSATAYADRTYDNGYVKMDPGTGQPDSLDPNTTWNWGFSDPAQYNSEAQTLTFQKQGAPGYNTLVNRSGGPGGDLMSSGLQLRAGLPLRQTEKWSADLVLSFQASWTGAQRFNGSTYREDVRQITVKDTYDVSGIPVDQFPATGFHGTYLGPFDSPPVVPSPVIPNLPANRNSVTSAALSTSYNSVGIEVQEGIYQLGLGPQFNLNLSKAVRLNLRPDLSINMIDAEVIRTERWYQVPAGEPPVVMRNWRDENGDFEIYVGLGITAGVDVDLGHDFYLDFFGGYDWVAEKMSIAVGPGTVSLDASSWVAGLSVGKRF